MDNTIRYKELRGTLTQKKKQFKKQLDKFEKDAKDGKILCLSDLMINSEHLHLAEN